MPMLHRPQSTPRKAPVRWSWSMWGCSPLVAPRGGRRRRSFRLRGRSPVPPETGCKPLSSGHGSCTGSVRSAVLSTRSPSSPGRGCGSGAVSSAVARGAGCSGRRTNPWRVGDCRNHGTSTWCPCGAPVRFDYRAQQFSALPLPEVRPAQAASSRRPRAVGEGARGVPRSALDGGKSSTSPALPVVGEAKTMGVVCIAAVSKRAVLEHRRPSVE